MYGASLAENVAMDYLSEEDTKKEDGASGDKDGNGNSGSGSNTDAKPGGDSNSGWKGDL